MTMIVTLHEGPLSNSERGRGAKAWIKELTGIDVDKSDGYAFIGTFAGFGSTVEAQAGTHYLTYQDVVTGRGTLVNRRVKLYRVDVAGLVLAGEWDAGAAGGWALRVRDRIAAAMAAPTEDADALRAQVALWRKQRDALDAKIEEATSHLDIVVHIDVQAS